MGKTCLICGNELTDTEIIITSDGVFSDCCGGPIHQEFNLRKVV